MNIKKIFLSLVILGTLTCGEANAATQYDIRFNIHHEYGVVFDGETFNVPEKYTFKKRDWDTMGTNEYTLEEVDMTPLHDMLSDMNSDKLEFSNGTLKINSLIKTITKNPLLNNMGLQIDSYNKDGLELHYKKNEMLNNKRLLLNNVQKIIDSGSSVTELYISMAEHLQSQIDELVEIPMVGSTDTELVGAISFMIPNATFYQRNSILHSEIPLEDHAVNYYFYTIIYRDLRIAEMKYNINGIGSYNVPRFDKDKYEYTIYLPSNTDKNSVISTNSILAMNKLFEENGFSTNPYIHYSLTDTKLNEANVELVDGEGTAKIIVVWENGQYISSDDLVYNDGFVLFDETLIQNRRTYTLNFKVLDYQKGDMNGDGVVDSIDTAIVLTKYKANSTTSEDLDNGDMNNDGVLDAIDAAMIATIYRNN